MRRFARADRLSEEIKGEIAAIIRDDVKDPRVAPIVSITRVELSRDLRNANVLVSVFGPDEQKEATIAALRSAAGFIRSLIGRRLRVRAAPELNFKLDRSIEHLSRIGELLKDINPAPAGESGEEDKNHNED